MSPNKRRKLSPAAEETEGGTVTVAAEPQRDHSPRSEKALKEQQPPAMDTENEATASDSPKPPPPTSSADTDRLARFAALKARATDSARSNLAAAKAESQRSALDPTLLANLSRRSAIAQHNLLKADTEESDGTGAFERKRAWDYTIEESEKWDERMAQKKASRDKNAFQDYSAEAGKIYDRQVREMERLSGKEGGKGGRLREDYNAEKALLLESAARNGNLEIVELQNGEMVAIDKDGRFYADHDSTGFVEQKPKKENVDRLVDDLRKAEEVRLKKRRERGRDDEQADVSYINEKNKQFNMKLARFYDRYTGDIRESFERGTAI
jgi:pre-mRNA-splicing factor SYF2